MSPHKDSIAARRNDFRPAHGQRTMRDRSPYDNNAQETHGSNNARSDRRSGLDKKAAHAANGNAKRGWPESSASLVATPERTKPTGQPYPVRKEPSS